MERSDGMHYEGDIIRPPSEGDSILLQVTVGCSHNKCSFCGAHKGRRFAIKRDETILEDIAFAAQYCKRQRRVFLCDGDALIIPQTRLVDILSEIRTQLPWVTRVGTYANAKSLRMKTPEQLEELRGQGLGIVYMGLESGDDATLEGVRKGMSCASIIEEGRKARQAGIKLSVTVILGLAGPERSEVHAALTGQALSAIDPEYVGALTLMLIPGTPLHRDWEAGRFVLPGATEMLLELRTMVDHTRLSHGIFLANHASNYLPIRARFPRDRESTIELIDRALTGRMPLRPEWLRAL